MTTKVGIKGFGSYRPFLAFRHMLKHQKILGNRCYQRLDISSNVGSLVEI